ncbi:MAG: dihydropteroate synthase [Pseudomonadota bacterium]|nr:dihydropteroate synthase [Pseudomonadota bacterium]
MIKYYTRACNFYYGNQAKLLIKKKRALPLCGNLETAFDTLEIFTRNKKKITSKIVKLKKINQLSKNIKKKVKKDLKKICIKRKNFLFNINFSFPSIMGILNLTPDSFSDGGKFNKKSKSFKHISHMINSGADIIDVGGESTRPGSKTIDPKIEWKRVHEVITKFKKMYKKTCLSIDTRKSFLMIKASEKGANLINDVSGFNYDKSALKKLKRFKIPKVLHHMQGTPDTMQKKPKYEHVLLDIYDFFEKNIQGRLKNNNLIIDPGIGFGKTLKHNLTLISKISLFHSLGCPILVGTSRKRFISQISKKYDSKDRTGGTLASIIFLLMQGVQIFRVHNVTEMKQGILVFKKILLNK